MFDFSGEEDLGRDQGFDGVESDGVTIPVFDTAAYELYPDLRWMYNKMALSDSQNIWNVPDGYPLSANDFPLFRKPIINLHGMSLGAEVVPDKETYDATYSPGHFLMPVLEGRHFSVDVAICKGTIKWLSAFEGFKDENGSFLRWEKAELPRGTYWAVQIWCFHHFRYHAGIINIETIGTKLIESHLRMSSQTADLNGDGWLDAVVNLYRSQEWKYNNNLTPTKAHSIPIRITQPGKYYFEENALIQAHQLCSSVQSYVRPEQDIRNMAMHDNYSFVLAFVNGFNLEDLSRAKQLLISGLRHQSPDFLDHPGDFCF